ncbi:MAG TPA: pseudouridine synthase, partial [Thermodesulfobacteriota bacterium]|nr:pseudouridine synthase [Thermodesulfobacteriota bacterium]
RGEKEEAKRAERLQKVIAMAGIASRRKAEEMILEGRVSVNGVTVTELGTKVDPFRDDVMVDGRRIGGGRREPTYILLNKPRGHISAASDPLGRPVVVDLVKDIGTRVFPVGRLDYDAEGVLLLTNDGELSNRLIHPRYRVPKKYLVKVKDVPTEGDLEKLEKGVMLDDGKTLPAKARLVKETGKNSWIELVVTEGRNRLVKRMCAKIGHPVSKIKRTGFAGIALKGLKPGEWRLLTPGEVAMLKEGQE